LNHLLLAEGRRLGAAAADLKTSLRTNDPDGGADALTVVSGTSAYMGPGEQVWQFKKHWPARAIREKELGKPAVQAAFKRGAGYTLVSGKSVAPPTQLAHEEELQDLAREAGCRGPVRVLHPEQVAAWASNVASAALLIHPTSAMLIRAEEELGQARHDTPFEPDALRSATVREIVERLFAPGADEWFARVVGNPGVGKSRLALEAVKAAGLAATAIYCERFPPEELFGRIRADAAAHAVLVADECDDVQSRRLEGWAKLCQGRLTLITVGPGPS
jgi:hypothetical protein